MQSTSPRDFIILGQGLAGSLLAWNLIQKGRRVLIIDDPRLPGASSIAAGLINPFAGKRLAFSWNFERHIKVAHEQYQELETFFNQPFYQEKSILRFYGDIKTQNDWLARMNRNPEMISEWKENIPGLKPALGAIRTAGGGQLNSGRLMDSMRTWLLKHEHLVEHKLDPDALNFTKQYIQAGEWKASKFICCEGYRVIGNPWFNHLPFQPTHGDLLEIEAPGLHEDHIMIRGVFLVPQGQNRFLAGATYYFDRIDPEPLEDGRNELIKRLKNWLDIDFKVTNHVAGVRSGTQDRRPFIGTHPDHPSLGIFNGLGSKGALLAPYWAKEAAAYFCDEKELDPEVHIQRSWNS